VLKGTFSEANRERASAVNRCFAEKVLSVASYLSKVRRRAGGAALDLSGLMAL